MRATQRVRAAGAFWPWAGDPDTRITILEGAISQNMTYDGTGSALRDLKVLAAFGKDGRWYYFSDDNVWAVAEDARLMKGGW